LAIAILLVSLKMHQIQFLLGLQTIRWCNSQHSPGPYLDLGKGKGRRGQKGRGTGEGNGKGVREGKVMVEGWEEGRGKGPKGLEGGGIRSIKLRGHTPLETCVA